MQALVDPRRGDLVWISPGLPGSTHNLSAARIHRLITAAARAGVELLADKGYQGAGGTVVTPYKGRNLSKQQCSRSSSRRPPAPRGRAFRQPATARLGDS